MSSINQTAYSHPALYVENIILDAPKTARPLEIHESNKSIAEMTLAFIKAQEFVKRHTAVLQKEMTVVDKYKTVRALHNKVMRTIQQNKIFTRSLITLLKTMQNSQPLNNNNNKDIFGDLKSILLQHIGTNIALHRCVFEIKDALLSATDEFEKVGTVKIQALNLALSDLKNKANASKIASRNMDIVIQKKTMIDDHFNQVSANYQKTPFKGIKLEKKYNSATNAAIDINKELEDARFVAEYTAQASKAAKIKYETIQQDFKAFMQEAHEDDLEGTI